MAYAQAPVAPPPLPVPVIKLTQEELDAPFTGTFFLSPQEIAAIQRALKGKVSGPAPTGMTSKTPGAIIPTRRVISVSGVVYRAPEDWIVWMNGQKVTPAKLLPEIIDIEVKDSSKVQLKWYDVGLNSVIAITLRPHQTYDITTGILLPGSQ